MIQLYNEDCLDIMSRLDTASIDLILCDLPYGTTNCAWDTVIPFPDLWEQYKRVIKDAGAIVLFGIEPFSSFLRCSNMPMYRYDWYWKKERGTNFLRANEMPFKVIETASVFYKQQPTYNPQKRTNPNGTHSLTSDYTFSNESFGNQIMKGRPEKATNGARYEPDKVLPTQLLEFNRDKHSDRVHPTQKPVPLLEYLIQTYTNRGDLVLDNTMGSGSTGIAAYNLDRSFIGIEKDPHYFTVAAERIDRQQQQLKLPIDIG